VKPTLLVPLILCLVPPTEAAVFDFAETGGSDSDNSQNSGAGNVPVVDASVATITPTIDGIQLTLTATSTAGTPTIGANPQGVGVSTNGESSGNNTRIEADKGESLQISFDADVTLDSLRFGSFGSGDVATISLVSGTNPFTSGTSLTLTGNGSQGPSTDILLATDPIVSGGIGTIAAGTVLSIAMTSGSRDALLNEFTVSDPSAPPGDLVTSIAPTFPSPTLAENQNPGSNLGSTSIAVGNSKGQSFSLADDTSISGFVFEVDAITTTGNFTLRIYRAMDGLPWLLSPIFSDAGALPADLADGDLLQIDLDTPLDLERGSYTVALTGLGATSFNLPFTNAPLFAAGDAVRDNSSTNGWQLLTNPDADLIFAVLGTQPTPPLPPDGKPNIIFILADDLGWTDVRGGATGPNVIGPDNFGSDFYQTPNVARLAAEGLSFTHCYVQPNCAPTRAALLSGQYAPRSGNGVYVVSGLNRGNGTPDLVGPSQNQDVPASHVTHAETLQGAGYVTAHFGKYHVGNHEGGNATMPENQGFEYNFGGKQAGAPGSYYASSQVFHGNVGPGLDAWAKNYNQGYLDTILKGPASDPLHQRAATDNNPDLILSDGSSNHGSNKYVTDGMGDAAIAFLDDHHRGEMKDHPFFMQFHTYAVHTPIQARWDLRRKYADTVPDGTWHSDNQYAAMIEAMDQTIGRITDWLDDPNSDGNTGDSISDNTLVIFSSDNGGHIGPTDNKPLRHRKGSFWEGGLRVPLIVRRPGTVPAGQITDTLVHAVDFYPTILKHAGVDMPGDINFDGTSFALHMDDPTGSPRDRGTIFYQFPGYLDNRARPCSVAIKRVGGKDYKLIHNYDLTYVGNNPQAEGIKVLTEPWELYNLTDDISETTDLINGSYSNHLLYGELADTMAAELLAWLTQGGDDWNAKQPTYRSGGGTVPYPSADVPDITVPFEQEFRATDGTPDTDDNEVTLTWNSESGFKYDIEGSDTLVDWDPLQTGITATGASTTRTVPDPAIATSDRRFYRVVLRP